MAVDDVVRGLLRRGAGVVRRTRPGTVVVRGGVAAGLRMGTSDASADYRPGTNELPVQEALRGLLRPGAVFFDVGSNVGFFALLAAREVGVTGAVHAFEPVPRIAEAVRRNAALNGFDGLQVHTVAVSDTDGTAELMLAGHPGGATLSTADTPADLTERVTVRVVTLDGLVASGAVPPPDVVKIDVEGAEMQVLDGMTRLLTTQRPALVCELDAADPATLAVKVAGWKERMAALDYDVRDLASSYEGSGWHVYHATACPTELPCTSGQESST
ncbi:MAG: methyltransferase FkbM family [Frankiales bacterium]|jgi:FkbM family methyltransferase|nr:methyltransferase FkbM family [Frankiales bacterium]